MIQKKQVDEISQLKLKVLKWQRKHQDMKKLISSMSKQNEEEHEEIKLMFLTKKSKLVAIINELKSKLNGVNRTTDQELRLKDTAITRMKKEIGELKVEILKGKEIMMSTNLSIKAKRRFD